MRVTELAALRDEWYAVALLKDTPPGTLRAVRLFGEEFVLFVPSVGPPALLPPRCPHRGAHLSAATAKGATLACIYHGWEFDSAGKCHRIPQLEAGTPIPPRARLATFPVVERYGVLWACIGSPRAPGPPRWPEADELGWRVEVDFFEAWRTCALRIIDNNIDQSHPAFVHRDTFGDPTRPLVPPTPSRRPREAFAPVSPTS